MFEPSANEQFKPDKPYKGRAVLLSCEYLLTETAPQEFAETNAFRLLPEDNVATNPAVTFRAESFAPTEDFNPSDPPDVAQSGWQQPQQALAHEAKTGGRDCVSWRDRTR